MAHDVHFIANVGAWIPQVPFQDREQNEIISDGVLLSPIQRDGDIAARDGSDDEISNVCPFLVPPPVMAYGVGDHAPRIPDYNGEEEGKPLSHTHKLYLVH
jgi:hypothetical protein